jgi:broad specificity phosphatase PhoE
MAKDKVAARKIGRRGRRGTKPKADSRDPKEGRSSKAESQPSLRGGGLGLRVHQEKVEALPEPSRAPRAPGREARPGSENQVVLWLIRHAEVERKYQGVFGGRIDMDLSAVGRKQAQALATFLHGKPIQALYASPMKRVRQTLAPLAQDSLPQPVWLDSLREVDFGVWTGHAWGEIQPKFGVSAFSWLHQLVSATIPEAESAVELRHRLDPCLKEVLPRHAGQQIGIACHGGVIRVLLSMLLGWPLTQLAAVEIDYASVTQVIWTPLEARLQLLNFAPWRERLTPRQ